MNMLRAWKFQLVFNLELYFVVLVTIQRYTLLHQSLVLHWCHVLYFFYYTSSLQFAQIYKTNTRPTVWVKWNRNTTDRHFNDRLRTCGSWPEGQTTTDFWVAFQTRARESAVFAAAERAASRLPQRDRAQIPLPPSSIPSKVRCTPKTFKIIHVWYFILLVINRPVPGKRDRDERARRESKGRKVWGDRCAVFCAAWYDAINFISSWWSRRSTTIPFTLAERLFMSFTIVIANPSLAGWPIRHRSHVLPCAVVLCWYCLYAQTILIRANLWWNEPEKQTEAIDGVLSQVVHFPQKLPIPNRDWDFLPGRAKARLSRSVAFKSNNKKTSNTIKWNIWLLSTYSALHSRSMNGKSVQLSQWLAWRVQFCDAFFRMNHLSPSTRLRLAQIPRLRNTQGGQKGLKKSAHGNNRKKHSGRNNIQAKLSLSHSVSAGILSDRPDIVTN